MKVAVLGLGRFGRVLASALARAGVEVFAADRDAQLVEELKDEVAVAVRMDATDEKLLAEHGLAQMDVVVVAIGEAFESNVLATATLQQLGARRVITRQVNEIQGRILKLVGATEVIAPEDDAALRLAQRLLLPNVLKWMDFGDGFAAVQVTAPGHFAGRELKELQLPGRYGVNVMAVHRGGAEGRTELPRADTVLEAGDAITVAGMDGAIEKMLKK